MGGRGLESEATTLYATVCCIRDIRHNVLHSQSVLLLLVQPHPHTSSYTCCLPLKFTYLLSGNVCIIRRAFWCTLDDDEEEDYDGHGGTVTAKVKTRHAVFTLLHYIFSVACTSLFVQGALHQNEWLSYFNVSMYNFPLW